MRSSDSLSTCLSALSLLLAVLVPVFGALAALVVVAFAAGMAVMYFLDRRMPPT